MKKIGRVCLEKNDWASSPLGKGENKKKVWVPHDFDTHYLFIHGAQTENERLESSREFTCWQFLLTERHILFKTRLLDMKLYSPFPK